MFITINLQETMQDTRGQQVFYDLLDSLPVSTSSVMAEYNKTENTVDHCVSVVALHTPISADISDIVLKNNRSFFATVAKPVIDDELEIHKAISKIEDYQRSARYNDASYWIYNKFMDLYAENRIFVCDLLLRTIDADKYNIRILLSLLIATYSFRSRLNYRAEFYSKVQSLIYMQYSKEETQQILGNLGR